MLTQQPTEVTLSQILEASLNGIITYESIRDEAGQIIDFQFVRLNAVARQLLHLPDDVAGKPMLEQLPGVKEAGLFDQFAQVVETGEPRRFDVPFPAGDDLFWYDMSVVRLDDGFVVTFNDITPIKRTTLENDRQRVLLDGIVNASLNGIITYQALRNESGAIYDFRAMLLNPVAQRVLALPDVEPGWLILDKFPGVKDRGLFEVYVQVVETGQPQRFETPFEINGVSGWYDVAVVRLDDGFVITFNDITESKQATMAVERQTALLNSVLDSSINGIMSFDAIRDETNTIVDFRILTANAASEQFTQLPAQTLVGSTAMTLFPANVETGLFARYVHTTETGEPTHLDVHYEQEQGSLDIWLNITAQKLGDGFVVTFADISVSKRAAQAIEQAARQLQMMIDTSQTGIMLISPVRNDADTIIDFRFRVVNRQVASYVGQQPDTLIGALASRWFPDYRTNGLLDRYRQTCLTGEPQRFDFHYQSTITTADVWFDIASARIDGDVLVTFSDYTTLKQLQQQLEQSILELQRSNQNLEQFAYVASHDLQEPLRKIQAFGDIIQTRYAPVIGSDGADMIRRMQSAANRMQVLIKDVLAYSRVATRRETVAPVNLNTVLDEVENDLETVIEHSQAIIRRARLPTLPGDAPQLRQLFQNLISNALKFRQPGQTPIISVMARLVPGRDTPFSLTPTDGDRLFYQITVADNGIGFEPHYAQQIFQIFQRLHGRTQYEGTGIGLAIVQKVVENHQGYIRAEGQPGAGATFDILLPAGDD